MIMQREWNFSWIKLEPKFIVIIIINLYLYTKSYHFYMVFLGIVCKIKLKYSKELLDYKVKKIQKAVLLLVK